MTHPAFDPLPDTSNDLPLYGPGPGPLPPAAVVRSRRAAAVGRDEPWSLFRIVPSEYDEHPAERAQQLVSNLGGIPLALEVVAADGRAAFFLRAPQSLAGLVTARFRAAFPHADFREILPDEDPGAPSPGDGASLAVRLALKPGPAWPLQRLGSGWRGAGANPPPAIAAAGFTAPGERIVTRLTLTPAPGRVAGRLQRQLQRVQAAQEAARLGKQHYLWQSEVHDTLMRALTAALIGAVALGAALFVRGMYLHLAGLVAALVLFPVLVALARDALFGRPQGVPAEAAREKLSSGPLVAGYVELLAFGPPGTSGERLGFLLQEAATLFGAVDHPLGGGLVLAGRPGPVPPPPAGPGPRRRPDAFLNSAEVALLWHLPAQDPHVRTAGSRYPLPDPRLVAAGCRLGTARYQDRTIPVHMPARMIFGHQLAIAGSGKGKSTFLVHLGRYVLQCMAQGREPLSLVVLDPHGDLAQEVAAGVPPALLDRTVYLDLGREDSTMGINVLDRQLFPQRELAVEQLVNILHRLWPDNWGPRMESMLRVALGALHEANARRPRHEQYTLLDVSAFLTNRAFRSEVWQQVRDPGLAQTWAANFDSQNRQTQQASIHPVTTKIGRFVLHDAARLLFGQPASTFDPRDIVSQGYPLIVKAPRGVLGDGGAELVGATLLNLVAHVVEAQAALPPEQRRRIVALVDESATLAAADYERMLAELRKYGLSIILVTQNLGLLEKFSDTLRSSILANIVGLTVFNVSGDDAPDLCRSLGHAVDVEDLVMLPDHECYARWTADGRVIPTFRFRLDLPDPGDPVAVETLAAASARRFGRPRETVRDEVNRRLLEHGVAGTGETVPILAAIDQPEDTGWREA